ncbi:MAG: hypothetical protein A2168_01190 [Planctomycetes bacterium RBG_13_50_24]|nr:MAG: hypothetical protein A2168_01190 [Planctomycetes bacterium RBG_13_50_24]
MSKFLDQINSPADVKRLSVPQLQVLAEEIRRFILETVSKTGGHLASNLGVVELTLALHCVFDFKTDMLLWDVGHQCYTHKIITGRKDKFVRLRHSDGISGFPNPAESQYDQFAVGHAGTSIATAIGLALAEQLKNRDPGHVTGDPKKIVAIIGDASIVNGTSFEALNNLGLVKRQLLIVLNDNSMAIDATVGAMAKYFSRVRLSQTYESLRKTTRNILEHMPVIGKSVEETLERIKKGIRMVLPASQMFESLNIPYFGPVAGHDIGSLIELFEAMGELNHPAILHVYTRKGKGFRPAEWIPNAVDDVCESNQGTSKFHSTGPFKINGDTVEWDPVLQNDGKMGTQKAEWRGRPALEKKTRPGWPRHEPSGQSFTSAFGENLTELAQHDEKIVAITSAMCDGTGLMDFRKKFPDRFYDVGIAESAAVDVAAGMARNGLKPVVCIYSTFLQRGFDYIFQEVALQNLPVVFCIDRAGFVGSDGPTHHGLMDIGFLRMMPNMVLTAPANDIEMKLALEFALSEGKPVVIRYPKDIVPSKEFVKAACAKPFKLGQSVTIKKSKRSAVAVVSYGNVLTEALKAASLLAEEKIAIDVINGRFAAPVDEKIISLLEQGKSIVTVEDHAVACGFGSAVLELAAEKGCSTESIHLLGAPRRFIGHNSRDVQLMEAGANADKIAETVRKILKA